MKILQPVWPVQLSTIGAPPLVRRAEVNISLRPRSVPLVVSPEASGPWVKELVNVALTRALLAEVSVRMRLPRALAASKTSRIQPGLSGMGELPQFIGPAQVRLVTWRPASLTVAVLPAV